MKKTTHAMSHLEAIGQLSPRTLKGKGPVLPDPLDDPITGVPQSDLIYIPPPPRSTSIPEATPATTGNTPPLPDNRQHSPQSTPSTSTTPASTQPLPLPLHQFPPYAAAALLVCCLCAASVLPLCCFCAVCPLLLLLLLPLLKLVLLHATWRLLLTCCCCLHTAIGLA